MPEARTPAVATSRDPMIFYPCKADDLSRGLNHRRTASVLHRSDLVRLVIEPEAHGDQPVRVSLSMFDNFVIPT